MILDNLMTEAAVCSLFETAREYILFKVLNKKCGLICAFKKESSAWALSVSALAALSSVVRHCLMICKAVLTAQTIMKRIMLIISMWPRSRGGGNPLSSKLSGKLSGGVSICTLRLDRR